MKYRIGIGTGGLTSGPEEFATVVGSVRQFGFDSLWIPEILTAPGLDVTVALTWAAQLDPRLKIGTTMLLPGRNPVRLAKSLATLDVLSGGRLLVTFVPGLAHGAERDAIGVPVAQRGRAIEETLPRLRRWWAGEEVDGITVEPRPTQQPLECWLGGIAPAALVRCGRFADGWLTAACTPEQAANGVRVINEAAAAADRAIDPEHFGVSIGYSREPLSDTQLALLAARTRASGTDPRDIVPVGFPALRDRLQEFMSAGLSKFVLRPMLSSPTVSTGSPGSTGLAWTDELAELSAAVGDLQS